jgi:MFS family permease
VGKGRRGIGESVRVLGRALSDRVVRRTLVAFVAFNVAEWATYIAVLVYAFGRGGTTEAAVVAMAQLVPAAVVAPIASALADRYDRGRVLFASYVLQAGTQAIAAVALLADAPAPLVYAAAVLSTTSVVLTRPVHGALLPSIVRTPAELTAANAASGAIQNASALAGPALAGLVLGLANPGTVFAATAVAMAAGSFLVAPLRRPASPKPVTETAGQGERHSTVRAAGRALRALRGDGDSRLLVLLLAAQSFVLGSLDVLFVAAAISLLGMGQPGVGMLNAAVGLGGILGAAAALLLAGRPRLSAPIAAGVAAWSAPLAVVGAVPGPLLALMLLVVAGSGRGVADVAGRTLLQRAADEEFLLRVLGILEGLQMAAIALGSLTAAGLVGLFGVRGALLVIGAFLPILMVICFPRLRRIEATRPAPAAIIALLRSQAIFAPLPAPELERVARRVRAVTVTDGAEVIREGDPGDRFYIVADGQAEVIRHGVRVAVLGPGESFGEIALLRDVPRTATVRAAPDLRLYALDRDDFLAAVTGHAPSVAAANAVVSRHLAQG